MDALKLKIFDVLLERITVSQFENWLYDSEEILNDLESNSLYFDVITINYRNKTWNTDLENLVKNSFSTNYYEILEIKKICSNVIITESFIEIHNLLKRLVQDFDYHTDYSILWKLYVLEDYFDMVTSGIYEIGTFQEEAKFYSEQTLKIIEDEENFESIKKALKMSLLEFSPREKI